MAKTLTCYTLKIILSYFDSYFDLYSCIKTQNTPMNLNTSTFKLLNVIKQFKIENIYRNTTYI